MNSYGHKITNILNDINNNTLKWKYMLYYIINEKKYTYILPTEVKLPLLPLRKINKYMSELWFPCTTKGTYMYEA